MKQIYFVCALALSVTFGMNAQNVVTVDGSAAWVGYANVFETDANGGGFAFGSAWGIPDLKSTVDVGGNVVTVQPNFNTYGDGTDPFWVDQTTGNGNKVFEANTFVEDASLIGTELAFRGTVDVNDLDAGYEAVAFIKVFNADFSVLKEVTAPMVAGEVFTVQYTDVEAADTVLQYGFKVTGLNANPADEATLGSIAVGVASLSTEEFSPVQVSVFPNPSVDRWTISSSTQTITGVDVFDILGKKVVSQKPNATNVSIEAAQLRTGVYIANITTTEGSKSIKLIKR